MFIVRIGEIGDKVSKKARLKHILKHQKYMELCFSREFRNYKTFDEEISSMFQIENTPEIKYLCNMISNVTANYNKENGTNVSKVDVAVMMFKKQGEEIKGYTLDGIKNSFFGFFSCIMIYCMLLSDKAYKKMKYKNKAFNKVTFCIEGYSSSELKKRFLEIMDDCYIEWCIDALSDENIQSPNNLKKQMDGGKLFDSTLVRFMLEYEQVDDSFIKIK